MPDEKKAASKKSAGESSARGRAQAEPAATAGRRSARSDGARGGLGGSSPRGKHSLDIRKTYKLYIGGGFPRSESGWSYPVTGADGDLLSYAAQASRKDARGAVTAARAAFGRWSGATAYNRGQVLYRVAE